MVHSPADFIRIDLGGAQKVAERTGHKPSAVRMWVHRNKVPRTVWPDLLAAYDNLTLNDLRAVESAGKQAA
jgi:hypothetical protein